MDKQDDLFNVANNKMTESEFAKKYYKDNTRKSFSDKTDNDRIALRGGVIGVSGLISNPLLLPSEKVDNKNGKEVLEKLKQKAKKSGIGVSEDGLGPVYDIKNKTIHTGKNNSSTSFSHELGHAHYFSPGWKGKRVGKAAHSIYSKLGGTEGFKKIMPVTAITSGTTSGIRKANLEKEGKKESKLSRHMAWAAPAIVSTPMLVSEALASKKGLSLLKKSGADKKLLSNARKELGKAWGTYGTVALANSGLGELSRGIAYHETKKKNKKK